MIGGNLNAIFQVKSVSQNEIGEGVNTWTDVVTIKGFLDSTGTSSYEHKTKSVESTHTFICDYGAILRDLEPKKCRCVINNIKYEVKYIDDPMELHDHLEISLKMVGVANE